MLNSLIKTRTAAITGASAGFRGSFILLPCPHYYRILIFLHIA
jgi:hypothetical protein